MIGSDGVLKDSQRTEKKPTTDQGILIKNYLDLKSKQERLEVKINKLEKIHKGLKNDKLKQGLANQIQELKNQRNELKSSLNNTVQDNKTLLQLVSSYKSHELAYLLEHEHKIKEVLKNPKKAHAEIARKAWYAKNKGKIIGGLILTGLVVGSAVIIGLTAGVAAPLMLAAFAVGVGIVGGGAVAVGRRFDNKFGLNTFTNKLDKDNKENIFKNIKILKLIRKEINNRSRLTKNNKNDPEYLVLLALENDCLIKFNENPNDSVDIVKQIDKILENRNKNELKGIDREILQKIFAIYNEETNTFTNLGKLINFGRKLKDIKYIDVANRKPSVEVPQPQSVDKGALSTLTSSPHHPTSLPSSLPDTQLQSQTTSSLTLDPKLFGLESDAPSPRSTSSLSITGKLRPSVTYAFSNQQSLANVGVRPEKRPETEIDEIMAKLKNLKINLEENSPEAKHIDIKIKTIENFKSKLPSEEVLKRAQAMFSEVEMLANLAKKNSQRM